MEGAMNDRSGGFHLYLLVNKDQFHPTVISIYVYTALGIIFQNPDHEALSCSNHKIN